MLCYGQVGINTTTPAATLDIIAKTPTGTSTTVDGLIVPRVDRQRAQSMTSAPTSTIIYVNDISTGTQTGTAVNIDAVGLYTYNGAAWNKLGSGGSGNSIYTTDGTLTGNRIVSLGSNNISFTGPGNVGVGTSTPGAKLEINNGNTAGAIKIVDGTQAAGNVLTSDANGIGSRKSTATCDPNITSGTIAHNQPYGCSGYNPGVFISSAADPGLGATVTYSWQQSTDNGLTWSAASGTNNIQNYDPPALTVPTKFRRAAGNYCGAVYSNEVAISIDGASSGIVATPCATTPGGSLSLSLILDTGASVTNWTISPSTGMSFSSTTTATTILNVAAGAASGIYTVTATVNSTACGSKTFTKTITIVPATVNIATLKRSCKEILSSGLSTGNGAYWIDPDGSGNVYCAEQVYCNMIDQGGGWTLILKSMNNNTDFQYSSAIWASGTALNNTDFNISNSSTANSLYNSYNYLSAKEYWIDFVTTPDLTPFTVPLAGTPKALATSTLNTNIANQYLNQPCQTSGMNSTFFTPNNAYNFMMGGVGNGINIGVSGYTTARFGVISNNENNEIFNSSDSSLGIGIIGPGGGALASGNSFASVSSPGCGPFIGTNGSGFYKALLWAR